MMGMFTAVAWLVRHGSACYSTLADVKRLASCLCSVTVGGEVMRSQVSYYGVGNLLHR